MSSNQHNRRNRGRSGGDSKRYHSLSPSHVESEDPQTFWARSNARLGIEGDTSNQSHRKTKPPIDFACAVCGTWVMLEKWPKDLQAVRCHNCQSAVAGLLDDDEKESAAAVISDRREHTSSQADGLPVLTDEDREAIEEMRKLSNQMGNGRVGNRRRGSGSGRRKRRGQGGQGGQGGSGKKRFQHGGKQQAKQSDGTGSGGGGSRRRRRRRGGRGGRSKEQQAKVDTE